MPAQLNFSSNVPALYPMADVLQAYVCDHLTRDELNRVRQMSKGSMRFVEKKHLLLSSYRDPQHLGSFRKDLEGNPRALLRSLLQRRRLGRSASALRPVG